MAVTSFLLVAFYRQQRGALEAGVKYLVQSAVGSALVLIGIAFVFAQTGTLDLQQIAATAPRPLPPQLLAAGGLFLIGFGVKAAFVPLHTWLPDAPLAGPERHQRDAVRHRHRGRTGRDAAVARLPGAGERHLGRDAPRLRRAQHGDRQPDGPSGRRR